MSQTELARRHWEAFFERLAPLLRASVVQVETSGLGLGDRIAADWARLAELSYDAGKDLLEIGAHGADRTIHRPARIYVRDEEGWLQSIEIVDGEGRRDFVIFKEPLHLAAPL